MSRSRSIDSRKKAPKNLAQLPQGDPFHCALSSVPEDRAALENVVRGILRTISQAHGRTPASEEDLNQQAPVQLADLLSRGHSLQRSALLSHVAAFGKDVLEAAYGDNLSEILTGVEAAARVLDRERASVHGQVSDVLEGRLEARLADFRQSYLHYQSGEFGAPINPYFLYDSMGVKQRVPSASSWGPPPKEKASDHKLKLSAPGEVDSIVLSDALSGSLSGMREVSSRVQGGAIDRRDVLTDDPVSYAIGLIWKLANDSDSYYHTALACFKQHAIPGDKVLDCALAECGEGNAQEAREKIFVILNAYSDLSTTHRISYIKALGQLSRSSRYAEWVLQHLPKFDFKDTTIRDIFFTIRTLYKNLDGELREAILGGIKDAPAGLEKVEWQLFYLDCLSDDESLEAAPGAEAILREMQGDAVLKEDPEDTRWIVSRWFSPRRLEAIGYDAQKYARHITDAVAKVFSFYPENHPLVAQAFELLASKRRVLRRAMVLDVNSLIFEVQDESKRGALLKKAKEKGFEVPVVRS